jgi:hypothetical protein
VYEEILIGMGAISKTGTLVLLDIYGMNLDTKNLGKSECVSAVRFKGWNSNLFDFIPQGGGDPLLTTAARREKLPSK